MSYAHYRLCSYAHTMAKASKLHWRYASTASQSLPSTATAKFSIQNVSRVYMMLIHGSVYSRTASDRNYTILFATEVGGTYVALRENTKRVTRELSAWMSPLGLPALYKDFFLNLYWALLCYTKPGSNNDLLRRRVVSLKFKMCTFQQAVVTL